MTYNETYRTPQQAAWNAKKGIGVKNSLHCLKLAADLNLFKKGRYLSSTKSHRILGAYWESLSTPGLECSWGGRFGDGTHYSIVHNGVR